MIVKLQITASQDIYPLLKQYTKEYGSNYEMKKDKNDISKIIIGLISVDEDSKQFNGIEPSYSIKNKMWQFGLYLNSNDLNLNANDNKLDIYIKNQITNRIKELKDYKILRGIKDRSMLEDIINLFS